MKKAIKFTYLLSIYITALFIMAMFMTYFSEWLQSSGFFGDSMKTIEQINGQWQNDIADNGHYWGARHYWYFYLCIILFLLSLARIVLWVLSFWEKELKS